MLSCCDNERTVPVYAIVVMGTGTLVVMGTGTWEQVVKVEQVVGTGTVPMTMKSRPVVGYLLFFPKRSE